MTDTHVVSALKEKRIQGALDGRVKPGHGEFGQLRSGG